MGDPGFEKLTFQVMGIGARDLNLYYAQSWTFESLVEQGKSVEAYKQKVIHVFASSLGLNNSGIIKSVSFLIGGLSMLFALF